jgi:two-component system cell cycle sensor histidine kinase/response regulator CckA
MGKSRPSEIAFSTLQLLLVGDDEQDFICLRKLLVQAGNGEVSLDHARSSDEALLHMGKASYGLVLCDSKSGDSMALRLFDEIPARPTPPVIFLSDPVNEVTVAAAIQTSTAVRHPADHSSQSRMSAVCQAVELYCQGRQRQKADDMLSKMWRAVEQTADLVVITDRTGIMEYVNPAFETLTGYSSEEAIGRTLRILKSKQQVPGLYQEMWRTILSGETFRGTVISRKKNGETFLAEKTVTPLRDAEQRITHFISTDRDITELRRLEAQLERAQRMDAIGRLAGGVAHDFNNLLMVISAYAELMLESLVLEHPLRRNVTEIMTAAGRATDLTRQLLAFGRKQMQLLRVLDLNTVITEISRMLPRLIGEDIQLVIVPGCDLGRVKVDPVQIEQVLMNLAANARDAMPRGGRLTIETANIQLDEAYLQRRSVVPVGDYVVLTVTDLGQGIAPEHMAHIFEPFYTTKEVGKGTGLGLATVYGIVKQNQGFIWVYSEPGLGTTFKIYLPRVWEQSVPPLFPPVEKAPRGSETLLLVEDEAAVRESEEEFLRLSGYTVLEARDGEHAVRVARDYVGTIHLMISDVVMPNMGGAELRDRLGAARPLMRVLFVSGYAESTVLQHGAIDVGSRFLQKPFTLKSLARKIRDVLGAEEPRALVVAGSR